jgi:hypothetical protein
VSSVLQLALKHLDELSHGTVPRGVPAGQSLKVSHRTVAGSGTNGMARTPETLGTVSISSQRRCVVCGQPARFGFGVRLRQGEEGRWFCAPHRPQEAGTS